MGDITLNPNTMVAKKTDSVTLDGNLPSDAVDGTKLDRLVKVYDAAGTERSVSMTFTKAGSTWNIAADDNGTTATGSVTYTNGKPTAGGNVTVNGITIDVSKVSGYAAMSSLTVSGQNGAPVGKLESYTLGSDGSLVGSFSNGVKQVLAKIALAKFTNPGGLEKAGGSPTSQPATPAACSSGCGRPRPWHPDRRLVGNVERGPVPGIHQPDRRAARFPGQRPHHHHLG